MTESPEVPGLSEWRPIARGGLAVVWEARQLPTDRRVAVKVYQRALQGADQHQFLREASVGRRLSAHPGIVTTYSAGILPDDRPYLVMELCPGGSLTKWLKPENRPSEERVRQVGLQIADVLAAAHAAGVLHRDLKPANILLDGDGNPRLADFGLAVELGAETETTEALWLSPSWAPPEAFRRQPATEAGDVYSLAATLYALLAGRPPRTTGSGSTSLEQLVNLSETPIHPIPGVSRPLMQVLLAALADDPDSRPSAAAFFGQLAKVPLRTPRPESSLGNDAPVVAATPPPVQLAPVPASAPAPSASGRYGAAAAAMAPATPAAGEESTEEGATEEGPRQHKRRRLGLLAVAAALVIAVASGTAWLIGEPASSSAPAPLSPTPPAGDRPSTADPSPTVGSAPSSSDPTRDTGEQSASASPGERSIRLADTTVFANPFEAARLRGTYRAGTETLLRVQRWEEGAWLDFPIPTMTDQSGQFVAYVELGQPGRYRLRVLEPSSGTASEPVMLVVKG